MSETSKLWRVKSTAVAKRTLNEIRNIVDKLDKNNVEKKPLIQLDIGDPTVFGNFKFPESVVQAISGLLHEVKYSGYASSKGIPAARAAVAKKFSCTGHQLTPEDVVITSACSGALDIAISALADTGDNILIPAPGFSLYRTLCTHKGVEARGYSLLAEKDWEADLEHMEQLIDDKTKAILVNNPSNPCGSVYSKEHLAAILAIAEKHRVPVIADEIYANIVFSGVQFVPMASLTDTVPILSVGGLAKQYMVPGWRIGWIILYDKQHLFDAEVRDGIERLTTLINGSCSLIQGVVPTLLHDTPQAYYDYVIQTLEANAEYAVQRVQKIPGLTITPPKGAMYCLVKVDTQSFDPSSSGIVDDVSFASKLLKEQGVSVLPGQCFQVKNHVRLVICAPLQVLQDAFDRMEAFCLKYHIVNK